RKLDEMPPEKGRIDPKTGKPIEDTTPKLTPEEAKHLAALQKLLADLSKAEAKNADTARQFSDDLKRSTEQGGKLELMPQPLLEEMKSTQSAFDRMVARAMSDLAKKLGEGADPKKVTPNLKELKERLARLDEELEATKRRLDALDKA